jgi:hypothetical protein
MDNITLTKIIAYIGAAAWVPHIAYLAYKFFITPKVRIIPDETASIGFTSYGPIFNLNLAISTSRKDVIINKIFAEIKHEDGSSYKFEWKGWTESISEIKNYSGEKAVVEKVQPALAIKVPTLSLTEKFVRFQEKKFHENFNEVYDNFEEQFIYLKNNDADFIKKSLASKEFQDMLDFYKSQFCWRNGKYKVSFKIETPERFKLIDNNFQFELKQYDIDRLSLNNDNIKLDYSEIIKSNQEDYEMKTVPWVWRNVKLKD